MVARSNADLQRVIDQVTDPWGVKVTAVEIKDVGIPSGMQRAMARQAEAERERGVRDARRDPVDRVERRRELLHGPRGGVEPARSPAS